MKEQEERLDNREKELKEKESKINKSVSDEVGDIRDKLEKNTNSNPTHCMHSSLEQHSIAFWSRFSNDSIYDFLLKYKPLDLNVVQWVVFIGIVIVLVYGDTFLIVWYAVVWQWKWWKMIENEAKTFTILDI